MTTLDASEKQLTFKFVYCGPALAGKTTNLCKLYELVDSTNRGRLMTLDGSNDRTLFFSCPSSFGSRGSPFGSRSTPFPGSSPIA